MATELKYKIALPSLDKDGQTAILTIRTGKANRGGIDSHASVGFHSAGFFTFELFGDYSQTLRTAFSKTATKKNLLELHSLSCCDANIAIVTARALAFYAAKEEAR